MSVELKDQYLKRVHKRHENSCVQEAYGSMFIESDSNIYYEKVV